MYITDLTHFLDEKGAIAPMPAPARRLAEFLGQVVAAATAPVVAEDADSGMCRCHKCKKKGAVITEIAADDAIEWFCENCGQEGRISNWRRSFWDLSALPAKR